MPSCNWTNRNTANKTFIALNMLQEEDQPVEIGVCTTAHILRIPLPQHNNVSPAWGDGSTAKAWMLEYALPGWQKNQRSLPPEHTYRRAKYDGGNELRCMGSIHQQ